MSSATSSSVTQEQQCAPHPLEQGIECAEVDSPIAFLRPTRNG